MKYRSVTLCNGRTVKGFHCKNFLSNVNGFCQSHQPDKVAEREQKQKVKDFYLEKINQEKRNTKYFQGHLRRIARGDIFLPETHAQAVLDEFKSFKSKR